VKHALQQSQIGDEQLKQQQIATQQAQQDQQDQQTVKQILARRAAISTKRCRFWPGK
jgi:hypothetical protein